MIPRYSRPAMTAIWEPENRFRIWFEIEAHACDALAELGVMPKSAAEAIWKGGREAMKKIDVQRIDDIEKVTKHDVIAFLTWLGDYIGPDSRFVHQGMTSSDVLDTAFAVQLTQAADILLADIDKLLAALKKRALEHKMTVTVGRSHGIHAEPTTFGVKLAGHYAEFARNRERLVAARKEVATCAISGAVGTFANIEPKVEIHVAAKLGLAVEPVSTQVIPRDRHAMFFATLGVIAGGIERLAIEIRHLQRSEGFCENAGLLGPQAAAADHIECGVGAIGRACESRVPMLVAHAADEPGSVGAAAREFGLTSLAAVPVLKAGAVTAVVAWYF